MSTPNPLSNTHSSPPPPISTKHIHIAGIKTHIYGLSELPPQCSTVSILWLLHPRLQRAESMSSIASSLIHAYNNAATSLTSSTTKGLIGISFDQRNHGTRLIDARANDAWREGNATHAQDMFGIYHGTARDTSLLIDHVGSYLFLEKDEPSIEEHLVLGISLGGHAAWQVLFADQRVRAGVVIIGCPDYIHLMTDRARLSKLPTYTTSTPPGSTFLPSPSFPPSLISACQQNDPKALLFSLAAVPPSTANDPSSLTPYSPQTPLAQFRILEARLSGKAILVCSGADDKLVPYRCSEPFLAWLKGVTGEGGWFAAGGVYLEDNVYTGVGHETSEGMVRDSARFVRDVLEGKVGGGQDRRRGSNL